jgi:uncharacterized protein
MTKRTAVSTALLVLLALALGGAQARAQCVSLTTLGSASTQNFDTLSNTAGSTTNNLTITGWFMTESGGGARDNEQYAVDTGSSTTGDTYSYGAAAATDRALGALRSGTLIPIYGACFTNNTGSTVTSLAVAYTGEQWRLGTAARTDQINFEYSTNATDLVTGTYTGVSALTFVTPVTATTGAKDGNSAANRTALSSTIASISIANGATFWIRWTDTDATGADDGLAVDDFSITPSVAPVTPSLSINDVSLAEGDSGTTTFSFTVSLSSPALAGGVTFDIATADGTAQDHNPAVEDNDYVASALTGQTIAAGNQTYTFSVTVNGDAVVEPSETFFVNVANVVGANLTDSQGQGTISNDDVTLTPIHDIQGSGSTSPVVGTSVSTRGIVTARKYNNGFFIQEPDASVDADPMTSEGIFVYTSSAPPASAAVGNLVQVTGTVSEFVPSSDPGQPPMTELTSPTVVQVSTGNALPAAIPLTATFPDPTGAYDQLERIESMRVSVASFTTTSGTLSTPPNETTLATSSYGEFFGVLTGVARPFREAGIEAPNPPPPGSTIPPLPRWDANPELLRVDSNGQIGTTLVDVTTGAQISNMVGVLDYAYRRYSILPDSTIAPSGGMSATAVQAAGVDDVTVGSFNLRRFFNNVADTEVAPQPAVTEPVPNVTAWPIRLDKVSRAIRDYLRSPDVVGVEEVENQATLAAIAAKVSADAIANAQPDPLYDAYVMPGNDVGGINVGFLVKKSLVAGTTPRVTVNAVVQEGQAVTWIDPSDNAAHLLNDRPPLRLDATVNFADGRTFPLQVIVVHQRSLSGVDDDATPDGLTTTGNRVRQKRNAQAVWLANLLQARQFATPSERIIVLGDFNCFEVNDGLVDVMGTLLGSPSPDSETAVAGDGLDLVNPNFTRLAESTPAERYSWVQDGDAQNLDHVIVNNGMLARALPRMQHARIDADFAGVSASVTGTAVRTSDHDPMVAYLTSDVDGDGIADSADPCNDLIVPAFAQTSSDEFQISGTVTDCSGVASVALGPGASNFTLEVFGNPGDTTRSWRVRRVVDSLPCDGELVAYDSAGTPEPGEFYVGLDRVLPVPALGSVGLALLGLVVALLGAVALGRRSTLL